MLAAVTDSDGDTIRYAYAGSRMTAIQKPDGSKTAIVYGQETRSHGPVATMTVNENGNAETFDYAADSHYCEHTDYRGTRHRYWYDEACRTAREEHDDGKNDRERMERGHRNARPDDGRRRRHDIFVRRARKPDRDFSRRRIVRAIHVHGTGQTRDVYRPRRRDDRLRLRRPGKLRVRHEGIDVLFEAAYDDAGNMTRKKTGNRSAETFTYDANGFMRARSAVSAGGTVTETSSGTPRETRSDGPTARDGGGRARRKENGQRNGSPADSSGITERDARKDPVRITETDSMTGCRGSSDTSTTGPITPRA
jgi:YD repeat-containing protein